MLPRRLISTERTASTEIMNRFTIIIFNANVAQASATCLADCVGFAADSVSAKQTDFDEK